MTLIYQSCLVNKIFSMISFADNNSLKVDYSPVFPKGDKFENIAILIK